MVTIVDYGMGNLGSIQNMFKRIGVRCKITGDPQVITDAEKILLPGVGAFDAAMHRIAQTGLVEVLNKKALEDRVPVLGICLGMQLLTNRSEEGALPGLGWIGAETTKFVFPPHSELKVPHMGWNSIQVINKNPLTQDLPGDPRFYFVHSYYVCTHDPSQAIAVTHHGIGFHSIINRENIYGAQFHPEKSHKFGMKLLENFANL